MDTDAAALQNALGVLQQQFGGQLAGPVRKTQAQMRQALEEQLGLDELAADRLVKKLAETGRLVYIGADQVPDGESTPAGSGALFDVPGALTPSGEERVVAAGTTAGVEATLSGINTVSGAIGGTMPAVQTGLAGARTQYRDAANLYANPSEAGARLAENREGATMGELGDTNIQAGRNHALTMGEAEALKHDDTHGYWRIG